MSSTSPQAGAAGELASWQASLASLLSAETAGPMGNIVGKLSGALGTQGLSGQLGQDAAIKSSATSQLNAGYDQAGFGSREAISYGGLRSGMSRTAPGAVGSAITSAATSLDRDRQSALRNLEFMSAQSSMADYNQVLQLLGQGTKTSLGLASGFSGAAASALGGMSNQSQMAGVLGGAGTGASLGSFAGPYGALIGGVAGGVIGGATSP